tara:strand:- start:797 stop:1561 length:765 start_codon:yes stop_codon:yes gene_type:complete
MIYKPKRKFGQNFLIDKDALNKLIDFIQPNKEDFFIEIGPGLGALTIMLIEYLKTLVVIEIDKDLINFLKKKFENKNLTIIHSDILKFDFLKLSTKKKIRVVGNLPYNISSLTLFHMLNFKYYVLDQHFLLQKEVAQRMVASPGSKNYGRLSVMLQCRYKMNLLLVLKPSSFYPSPKVESALVRMIPKVEELPCDEKKLAKVVTKAFSKRRKIIKNCFLNIFSENDLENVGIDPKSRPENLTVKQYIDLAKELH